MSNKRSNRYKHWDQLKPFDDSKITDCDWAWLAGIFEGEAYFGAQVRPDQAGQARLSLCMCDKDIVLRVGELLDAKVNEYEGQKEGYKKVYRITIAHQRKLKAIADGIQKYLGERRSAIVDSWRAYWKERWGV